MYFENGHSSIKQFTNMQKKTISLFLQEMNRIEKECLSIDTINFYQLVQDNYPDILDMAFKNGECRYL